MLANTTPRPQPCPTRIGPCAPITWRNTKAPRAHAENRRRPKRAPKAAHHALTSSRPTRCYVLDTASRVQKISVAPHRDHRPTARRSDHLIADRRRTMTSTDRSRGRLTVGSGRDHSRPGRQRTADDRAGRGRSTRDTTAGVNHRRRPTALRQGLQAAVRPSCGRTSPISKTRPPSRPPCRLCSPGVSRACAPGVYVAVPHPVSLVAIGLKVIAVPGLIVWRRLVAARRT